MWMWMIVLALVVPCSQGLHFYLTGHEQKCFVEELSKDLHVQGAFSTEILDAATNTWKTSDELKVHITVEVVSTMQRVVDKKADAKGAFNFVASDYGEHVICVSTSASAGWFSSASVRFHLGFYFGDNANQDHKKEFLNDLKWKVEYLKQQVTAVHREQTLQREREAEFRNLSEKVNGRVVWWTLLQMIVLGLTCAWQLRQLKTFFVSKKLV